MRTDRSGRPQTIVFNVEPINATWPAGPITETTEYWPGSRYEYHRGIPSDGSGRSASQPGAGFRNGCAIHESPVAKTRASCPASNTRRVPRVP